MVTYDSLARPSDIARLQQLLNATYWAQHRTLEQVSASLAASIAVFARNDAGELIGSARAVTDSVTFAWICDVVVDPQWQGQGIGKTLVSRLLNDAAVQVTRKILVTKDAQQFYVDLGFKIHPFECMLHDSASPL